MAGEHDVGRTGDSRTEDTARLLGALGLRLAARVVTEHSGGFVVECAAEAAPLLAGCGRLVPSLEQRGRVRLHGTRAGLATAGGEVAATLASALAWATAPLVRPAVWGVLNATPDSFSDGAPAATVADLVARGLELEAQGADVIDVGGESTRPGAAAVDAATESARVLPVVRELAARLARASLSVDTTKAEVARAALDLGARIVNDTSGGSADRAMLSVVAAGGGAFVCMHARGTPSTMQAAPHYDDTLTEVAEELRAALARCLAAGIGADRLYADPGLGFGKRLVDNALLLEHLGELRSLGVPLLVGASRKSFVGTWSRVAAPAERTAGSIAAAVLAAMRGAAAVRVHDVRATVEALDFVHGCRTSALEVPR
jgi:dihydropteroate synthase